MPISLGDTYLFDDDRIVIVYHTLTRDRLANIEVGWGSGRVESRVDARSRGRLILMDHFSFVIDSRYIVT